MTNSSYYFRRLIPGLTAEFRLIAPHFRGMGFSERAAYMPPGAWLEDVIALLDEVGVGSAHFYRVSLGALIGMRLAIQQSARRAPISFEAATSAAKTYRRTELDAGRLVEVLDAAAEHKRTAARP